MNLTILKLIACVSMLIDHVTATFIPAGTMWNYIGRGIGRIAMPIFCFALVEGFVHTRDVKKYFLRLSLFALVSELPFDLLFLNVRLEDLLDFEHFNYEYLFMHQNMLFTLIIGLFTITLLDYIRNKYLTRPAIYNTLGVIIIVGAALVAEFTRTDYTSLGVLCVLIFYFFRGNKVAISIMMVIWALFFVSVGNYLEVLALLALIPIFFYNGEKGKSPKYFFYACYPGHILCLYVIKVVTGYSNWISFK